MNQVVRNSKKVISDSETQEQRIIKDVKEKFSMDVTKHDEIIEDITSETINKHLYQNWKTVLQKKEKKK